MSHMKIVTPDPFAETLLSLLAEKLMPCQVPVVLLDAVWMERITEFPGHKIILFTASADPGYLPLVRKSGATGFWYLQPSAEALAQVLQGEGSFPEAPPVVRLGDAHSSDLTARELEVLREMTAGKTDAQIGEILNMSVSTVKHHIQQLRFKTGFANRTQMAVAAVSCGLIDKKLQYCNNYTFV